MQRSCHDAADDEMREVKKKMNEDEVIRSGDTLYARDEYAEYAKCDEMLICEIVVRGNSVCMRDGIEYENYIYI